MGGKKRGDAKKEMKKVTGSKKKSEPVTFFIPPDPSTLPPPTKVVDASIEIRTPRGHRRRIESPDDLGKYVRRSSDVVLAVRAEVYDCRGDTGKHIADVLLVEFPTGSPHVWAYAKRYPNTTVVEAFCGGHRTATCAAAAWAERLLVLGTYEKDSPETDGAPLPF